MQKAVFIFLNSAGALLLAMATALLLINWANAPDYVPLHDPLFSAPLNGIFRIVAVITAVAALLCFLSEHLILPTYLLL